jgi:hypothetical protein
MVLFASLSLLFLVMGTVGLLWSLVLLLFMLLAAAHVIGNSFSTRLRRQSAENSRVELLDRMPASSRPRPLAADPAAVRLRHQAAFRVLDVVLIAAASILGGGLGGAALWAAYWNRYGYSAIVVGTASSAVIGGFLGFLCVSFMRVALTAINDARQQSHPDRYQP